ncbi:hypothetical protein HCH_05681 [Hahella chejuensis KCTC 2396]|uniref:Nucleotide modification associated domain-containing protein n=1 Tax=Hahella chejuensis (strain KCTC 2396) TaxID=349521 RepID=Q2SAI8_HAHCH|nr:hypothetical protein [Hahella chejuensis]ABC32336.1 hypothetical protein HCH_05681 [Hahella chejuensis KCTC 2396]
MKPNIFRYVVRYDCESAPSLYEGFCVMPVCMSHIREPVEIDDWMIGFQSKTPNHVVYAMQVRETLSLVDYLKDKRFADSIPKPATSSENIHILDRKRQLEHKVSPAHIGPNYEEYIRSLTVLVSNKFWYFGANSQLISTDLTHLSPPHQGNIVHKNRRDTDLDRFKIWLSRWSMGIHGEPEEACVKLRDWLSALGANVDEIGANPNGKGFDPTDNGHPCSKLGGG